MNQIIKMVAAGSTQVPVDVSYNPAMVGDRHRPDRAAIRCRRRRSTARYIINSTLITKDNAGTVRLREHAVLKRTQSARPPVPPAAVRHQEYDRIDADHSDTR